VARSAAFATALAKSAEAQVMLVSKIFFIAPHYAGFNWQSLATQKGSIGKRIGSDANISSVLHR
jgi:hypothetical protein